MKRIILFFLLLSVFSKLFPQGEIVSALPSEGNPGQEMDIVLRGFGTNFQPSSIVDLGSGITVVNFNVTNAEGAIVHIKISSGASLGKRSISVSSKSGVAIKTDGFEVIAPAVTLHAQLFVLPVQSIRLSDFDANMPEKSPVLFRVTIFNDNLLRNISVKFTLTADQNGLIGTATKVYNNLAPNGVASFDNKQFDKYNVNSANKAFIHKALSNAMLPADLYTYRIEIFDDKGNKLYETETTHLLYNSSTKPELISPGALFDMPLENINIPTPIFQWFSQANSFDFALYPVFQNQTTAEEITLNRPVYIQKGIAGNNLLYPASAEILTEGKTYAWLITAHYYQGTGDQAVPSEVFRFSYKAKTEERLAGSIKGIRVEPATIDIETAKQYSFIATVYDENNNPVPVKVNWKVIPSDAGNINSDGLFTAGSKPANIAVVAQYGDKTDYSTVNIVFKMPVVSGDYDWDVEKLFRQIFGVAK